MRFNITTLSILLFLGFINSYTFANNQIDDKLKIEIFTNQLKESKVYFAKYYNGKPYTIDSTDVYKDGKYELKNISIQPEGEYLVYIKPNIQLPLLLGFEDKKNLNLRIDINDINTNDITIKGSKNTQVLWEFNKESMPLWNKKNLLDKELEKRESIEQYKVLTTEGQRANDSINMLIDKYSSQYKNSFLGTYLNSKRIANAPYPTPLTGGEKLENLNFIKQNFWNSIDLNNEGLWNSPTLYEYLNEYLYTIVSPEPDSIAAAASDIAMKMNKNKTLQQNYLTYMVNTSGEKKYVGQENIWAKLAEDYIIDREHAWIDSMQYSKLMQEYSVIKNNRIGNIAKNIKCLDFDGQEINTDSIKANYTILYFYSPTCGHCSTETPIIHDLMAKYKDDNVKVVAFNTTPDNRSAWENFIEQNKMQDWINVSDPENKSAYWLNYDVRGVPSIYILDKDKRIVIKNINSSDLEYILDIYLNKNQK